MHNDAQRVAGRVAKSELGSSLGTLGKANATGSNASRTVIAEPPNKTARKHLYGPQNAAEPLSAPVAYYQGKDLRITPTEREHLRGGNVGLFWKERLYKDPYARVGLAMCGGRPWVTEAIEDADEKDLLYWRPTMNILSGTFVALENFPERKFSLPPTTKQELIEYWSWLGERTRERSADFLILYHPELRDNHQGMGEALSALQRSFAGSHAAAVDKDIAEGQGIVPGLLSLEQAADYHHDVLDVFDLPPNAYGGTPIPIVPDVIELWVAGGLYARDSDPK